MRRARPLQVEPGLPRSTRVPFASRHPASPGTEPWGPLSSAELTGALALGSQAGAEGRGGRGAGWARGRAASAALRTNCQVFFLPECLAAQVTPRAAGIWARQPRSGSGAAPAAVKTRRPIRGTGSRAAERPAQDPPRLPRPGCPARPAPRGPAGSSGQPRARRSAPRPRGLRALCCVRQRPCALALEPTQVLRCLSPNTTYNVLL